MSLYVRTKRVTDPLDDRVKACICGTGFRQSDSVASNGSGSGSEHEADSCFLDDLVNGFLVEGDDCEDCGGAQHDAAGETDGSDDDSVSACWADPSEVLKPLVNPVGGDRFRKRLYSGVVKAAEVFSSLRANKNVFRRAVMAFLRELGYNAGVCKTKWESSGGLTGGNYEFIDVVRPSSREGGTWVRYFVDLEFSGEFEVARPTEEFSKVVRVLPRVFVGRSEELKQIVRLVSEAAKRSLKKRGMHLPPWRKNRYMQAKWLGPYRRTVNPVASNHNPSSFSAEMDRPVVWCRSVGFFSVQETTPVGKRGFVV
ncbi:uncharacterized protein [Aristolochia californica]|uniref:uncharacterized protein n=1 Tax=Aristolochia californica TaxID=171875 RepID=UPI0035D6CFF1